LPSKLRWLRDEFGVDQQLHVLPDGDAACLQQLIPAEAQILAVDCGGRTKAGASLLVRVGGDASERRIEHDFLCYAVQREVADDSIGVVITLRRFDASAFEGYGRIGLDVESQTTSETCHVARRGYRH
jgi:hypothetical protein